MNNANEPAFPDPFRANDPEKYKTEPMDMPTGLTKREYFAAMAMQGILANTSEEFINSSAIANVAVRCADALLLALSKPENTEQ